MSSDKWFSSLPYNFKEAVGDDEHLPGDLSTAAHQIAGSVDASVHLENEVVEELRRTFSEDVDLEEVTKQEKKTLRNNQNAVIASPLVG